MALVELPPGNREVTGWTPSLGTCSGCRLNSQWGAYRRQPFDDVSLSIPLPSSLKINKIFFKTFCSSGWDMAYVVVVIVGYLVYSSTISLWQLTLKLTLIKKKINFSTAEGVIFPTGSTPQEEGWLRRKPTSAQIPD